MRVCAAFDEIVTECPAWMRTGGETAASDMARLRDQWYDLGILQAVPSSEQKSRQARRWWLLNSSSKSHSGRWMRGTKLMARQGAPVVQTKSYVVPARGPPSSLPPPRS